MPKNPLTESIFARLTDQTRAAAIMGDLTELAATRGRLWFWTAYARTLITLGWRCAPVAFVVAFAALKFMFSTGIWWLMNHRTPGLTDPGLFGENSPHARMLSWNLSLITAQFLCFATPFILIRFGLHDRLTRLACVLFLVTIPVYSLRPWIMDLSSVATMLLIAATLVAPAWRRPLAVLVGTCLPAIAVKATYLFFLPIHRYPHVPRMSASETVVSDAISFAVAAIVCLFLYHRLLRQRPAIASETAAHA